MKRLFYVLMLTLCVGLLATSCGNSKKSSKLEGYEWLEGKWKGDEVQQIFVNVTPQYYQVVGEMWDESEIVDDAVKNTNKRNIYIVKGMMNISDFFARFHMDDEVLNEDYSTLSGWINDRLEKFARVGDKIKYGTVEIIVTKATEFTVEECSVHYYPRRRKDKE